MFNINETLEIKAGGEVYPLFLCGPASSAMDAAWDLLAEDRFPVWGSLLVESQSSGRGRMGRVWQSPPGHIYAAVHLPLVSPFDGPGASLALAFLLSQALKEFGWETQLKWPNDLIYHGGKVSGLLVENKKELVAGVGLNLNSVPLGSWQAERGPDVPPPVALPWPGEPKKLWSALVKRIILLYKENFGSTMDRLIPLAEEILLWRGRTVTVDKVAADPQPELPLLKGCLTGLGPAGQLKLINSQGQFYIWSGTVRLKND